MSEKKVVKFKNLVGFEESENGRLHAVLEGVSGHYRLGDQRYVTTSLVVKIDYGDKDGKVIPSVTRIETLNTIYEKEKDHE